MKQKIQNAYNAIRPQPQVQERIWASLEKQAHHCPPKRTGRKLLILAAAVSILACSGFAAYQLWHLPEPEHYETDPENGIYSIETEHLYSNEGVQTEAAFAETAAPDDAFFLAQAVQVLQAAGLEDVDTSLMRLVRQENLIYSRQEAEVFFENDAVKTSVKFDASFGHLLSLSSIDWLEEAESTDRDPGALAREYYEKLPVAQGYVLMDAVEQYDEQYWSYSFCKEVQPGLFSYYEMVRIAVNPVSGRLVGCNVFHFPLLDDHRAEDIPLTRQEAIAIAESMEKVDLTQYVLQSAQVSVVLPNWWFTQYMDGNLQYADVSRLGWVLDYSKPDSEFADEVTIWIDYYTGEVLGGGMT